MRIEYLYRYPVKGLTAEALEEVTVEPGETLPWDRAFALAQGDAPFDPAAPSWLQKTHFMCLMANARAAELKASFDPRSGLRALERRAGWRGHFLAVLAEEEGFEPPDPFRESAVFKTAGFNHSPTPPWG